MQAFNGRAHDPLTPYLRRAVRGVHPSPSHYQSYLKSALVTIRATTPQTAEGVELLEVDRFIFQNDPEGLAEWVRTVHARGGRAFLADDEADYYFTTHLGEVFRLEPRGPFWEVLPRSPGSPSEASR